MVIEIRFDIFTQGLYYTSEYNAVMRVWNHIMNGYDKSHQQ